MTEIVSLEEKNGHYIVVLRYSPNWLMRLFGKKFQETIYVSIKGCCLDIETDFGLLFINNEGEEMDRGDLLFVNRYIRNFKYDIMKEKERKERVETFRSVMGI